MKRLFVVLTTLMFLLGVSRTPEAQVGEAIAYVALGMAVGGCIHAAALKNPPPTPYLAPESIGNY